MKEQTFEELIEEIMYTSKYSVAMNRKELLFKSDTIKLMQQVRKATIKECEEKSVEFWGESEKNNINYYIGKIKTDHIKIK